MNTAPGSAANILAVDGGGTKTALAVVSPRGDVLARAAGGGINPFDQPRWAEILRDLIGQLSAPYGAAGLALPGYGEAAAVTAEQDAFAAGLGVPTQVLNDVDAAQQGAFAGGAGLMILAGTGSMAWGRGAGGETLRVGGWGDLLGDEGSAYWTGLQALNALTRALDGRSPRTPLHERLLSVLAGMDPPPEDAVLAWLVSLQHPRSQIAALSQRLDEWAEAGDPEAAELLRRAGQELALLGHTARRRLPSLGAAWSVAGSFTRSATVMNTLRAELGAEYFQAPALPPLGGSALAGARAVGLSPSPDWAARLGQQL